MSHEQSFFIGGDWVAPLGRATRPLVNPATEAAYGAVALGDARDVDRAVSSARAAFPAFSRSSREERIALLNRIIEAYARHEDELAQIIVQEVGAPIKVAKRLHVPLGRMHFETARDALASFEFDRAYGGARVVREPIGVCGLIIAWNWPLFLIGAKVAPAIAAGCTMVLKPSEAAPMSALKFAEIMAEAGVPAGVFNLINGDGPGAGQALCAHADVDMVSFTGSTRGGVAVAKAAADTVKRVHQELGGKSANILLNDADFPKAVRVGVLSCYSNAGQTCAAPTRMLAPQDRLVEVEDIARATAEAMVVGDPADEGTTLGPLINAAQFERVQGYLEKGVAEGARLAAGGPGRPAHLNRGYFTKATVFSDVAPEMAIAQEEIFGPALVIIPYRDEAHAIEIANCTLYGLAAYVQSKDLDRANSVAEQLRAGSVHINGAALDLALPFGGYRQSGNGREHGRWGLEEYLETKTILGARAG
jgi:aldehyde dehydrogenase (NAD+)